MGRTPGATNKTARELKKDVEIATLKFEKKALKDENKELKKKQKQK